MLFGAQADEGSAEAAILNELIPAAKRDHIGDPEAGIHFTADTPVPYKFADLMRLFDQFGQPTREGGDINLVDYLFLGDYVDRGKHSLEVICLLLALKICHPTMVTLLRGNHEDAQVNAAYGFRGECLRRCRDGLAVWQAVNRVFEWLPLAALVDDVVLCVHGGIGEQLQTLQQLKELKT